MKTRIENISSVLRQIGKKAAENAISNNGFFVFLVTWVTLFVAYFWSGAHIAHLLPPGIIGALIAPALGVTIYVFAFLLLYVYVKGIIKVVRAYRKERQNEEQNT